MKTFFKVLIACFITIMVGATLLDIFGPNVIGITLMVLGIIGFITSGLIADMLDE